MTKIRTVPARTGADGPREAPSPEPEEADGSGSPSSADYTVAFSPRQVAVGFAIVAGLVAIAIRRRRRGRTARGD